MDTLSPTRLFRQAAKNGRQPGSRNVIGATAKANIQAVFNGLGGWEAMLEWAKQNQDAFYGSVYPRILITESGPEIGSLTVIVQRTPTAQVLEHSPLEEDPRPSSAGPAGS